MFKNPEFIRNTWTELTAKKLAAMPLLLITVYLLAYILDVFSLMSGAPGWRRKR